MTYKGCEIIRTERWLAITGHRIYRVTGEFTKPAEHRPFLPSIRAAKEWINDQITEQSRPA